MGAEFLERTRKSYQKHIDRKRVELATPDLFTIEPTDKPRSVVFKVSAGASLKSGETVIVEPSDDGIVASKDFCEVARTSKATPNTKAAISKSAGAALGTIRKVNPLSRTIEVDLT